MQKHVGFNIPIADGKLLEGKEPLQKAERYLGANVELRGFVLYHFYQFGRPTGYICDIKKLPNMVLSVTIYSLPRCPLVALAELIEMVQRVHSPP